MPQPLVIAIAGASASGKSLLASTVVSELGDAGYSQDIVVLREDAYYRDQSEKTFSQRELTNYDHPQAFEHSLLQHHLECLVSGQDIQTPVYDFTQHNRAADTQHVPAAPIILLEGILVLHDVDLLPHYDIKVFVDTPLDVCLLRRIERDTQERGRSFENIAEQYHATVRPMYFEYVYPSRDHADVVITGGGKNRVAIEMLKARIISALKEKQ